MAGNGCLRTCDCSDCMRHWANKKGYCPKCRREIASGPDWCGCLPPGEEAAMDNIRAELATEREAHRQTRERLKAVEDERDFQARCLKNWEERGGAGWERLLAEVRAERDALKAELAGEIALVKTLADYIMSARALPILSDAIMRAEKAEAALASVIKAKMEICPGPSAILVFDGEIPRDLRVENGCHNHAMLSRCQYESALREKEEQVKAAFDYLMDAMVGAGDGLEWRGVPDFFAWVDEQRAALTAKPQAKPFNAEAFGLSPDTRSAEGIIASKDARHKPQEKP